MLYFLYFGYELLQVQNCSFQVFFLVVVLSKLKLKLESNPILSGFFPNDFKRHTYTDYDNRMKI